MPRRAFQGRLIGWAAIAVLSAYCLFIGGAWAPTYSVDFRIVSLFLAAAGVAVWILVAIRDPFWRPRSALAPAFAAAFAAFIISTLASSHPRFGAEYLAWAVILTALYLMLQRLMAAPFFRIRMTGLATIFGIMIGVAYVAVVGRDWVTWWGMSGRLAAPPLRPGFEGLTFGNPSAVLTASVLLSVPAVAHLWGGGRPRRALAIGIVALSLFVALLTGSRAGWLAIAAAIVIVGVLWLLAPDHRDALIAFARSRTTRLLAAPVVVAIAAVAVVAGPGLLARASAGGESFRATLFAVSLRMFEASPLVGIGPGTWAPLRTQYTLAGEQDYYIPHGHSIYFQTLAEFGMLGVLAGIVVVALLGRLLLGAVRDPDPARRRMGWAAVFATVYFAAHQTLDFYANAPAILFAFVIPIAWLDATAPPAAWRWSTLGALRTVAPRTLAARAALSVVVFAGACGFLLWSESGAAQMQEGTTLLDSFKAADAVGPLSAAVKTDPAMPPYRLALGLALADTGDLVGAETQFLSCLRLDDLSETWLDVAAVRARLGDASGADEALARALRLGVQQSAVALGAGVVQLELGHSDAARASFADALELSPSLAGDPWWTADATRAGLWPAVYAEAFSQSSPSGQFELAIERGDAAGTAAAIAAVDDPELAATDGLIVRARAGDAAALTELDASARLRPLDAYVVGWLARIYHDMGDDSRSAMFQEWNFILYGQPNSVGPEIRIATRPTPENVAGTLTAFHGHYAYRRPIPQVQLVSWLPQLIFD